MYGEPAIKSIAGAAYRGILSCVQLMFDSGWCRSRISGFSQDALGNPIPWLTYPAIEFLKSYVRPGMRILEFGTGASTVWFVRRGCRVLVTISY